MKVSDLIEPFNTSAFLGKNLTIVVVAVAAVLVAYYVLSVVLAFSHKEKLPFWPEDSGMYSGFLLVGLCAAFFVLLAAGALDGRNAHVSSDGNDAFRTFTKQTYGVTITESEADRFGESLLRDAEQTTVVRTADGTQKVTFAAANGRVVLTDNDGVELPHAN
jgi:hypothetical protein